MKKYLVAALVACLGILSVNAQVDKTIESQSMRSQ